MIVLDNKSKLCEDIVKSGLTITSLAQKIGYSKAHISSILKGTRNPSPVVAVKICEQIHKQFDDYFFIESVHK